MQLEQDSVNPPMETSSRHLGVIHYYGLRKRLSQGTAPPDHINATHARTEATNLAMTIVGLAVQNAADAKCNTNGNASSQKAKTYA